MSTEVVQNVTASLEKATINDATDGADAAHAVSAAEGRRLYIGNLNYNTTEEQLKTFFQNFSIESVSIPTKPHTNRAVGYAFVDLKSKDDAERAIAELSGHELLERKVSVQAARKPGTQTTGTKDGENNDKQGEGRKPRSKTGNKRRTRNRGSKKNRDTDEVAEETPTNFPGQVLPLTEPVAVKAAPVADATSGKKDKEEKAPRKKRGPPEDGVPSKTKVMVANLPYELTEDKLKELFAAYNPEAAKIALRPIRPYMVRILAARGEARKGRGFGFVTLATEEMQQKAIAEMNGKTIEGREIAVKVAIDNPKLEAEAEAKAAEEARAASADKPASDNNADTSAPTNTKSAVDSQAPADNNTSAEANAPAENKAPADTKDPVDTKDTADIKATASTNGDKPATVTVA